MTERELIVLYNKGLLVQEIADRAGMTRGTINNKLCALRKAKKIRRRPQNPSKERQQIALRRVALVEKYRKQRLTNEEIAIKIGISVPRVWQIVQELIASRKIDARINRFQ
jgi:DNA-binding CsgD family transcriptional regulator